MCALKSSPLWLSALPRVPFRSAAARDMPQAGPVLWAPVEPDRVRATKPKSSCSGMTVRKENKHPTKRRKITSTGTGMPWGTRCFFSAASDLSQYKQLGISLTLTSCMILPKPVSFSWPHLLLLYYGWDGVRLIISQSVVNRTIASNLSPQFLDIYSVCQLIQGLTQRGLAQVLLYFNGTSVLSLFWKEGTWLAVRILELIRPLPSAFPAITEHLFSWSIVVIFWLPISSPSVPILHGESDLYWLIPYGWVWQTSPSGSKRVYMTQAYPMRLYILLATVTGSLWACEAK